MFTKIKKPLVYLLATMFVLPTYLFASMASAPKVHAAGINTLDFGVMQFSEVNGYSVGFGLIGMTASDLKSVVVKLYEGETVLSTNTSSGILENYPTATGLSSPFNINGYFNYEADGNWSSTGWAGTVENVPTKATVLILDKSDKTYSAEYGAPTGDPNLLKPHDYTGIEASAVVQPQDFSTMRLSKVSGYNVGFGSTYKASQMKKIEVSLYDGLNLLATNVSDQITTQYPDTKSLSAPFDVNGSFDYVADAAWSYSGWLATLQDIPTRAVIKVTDKMDNTFTVENNTLTGTPLPYMAAQDFGVMQISNVNGYTVGFGLNGITAADVASVKVELFEGSNLLSTSNGVISSIIPAAAPSINSLGAATSLSSPFNIDGAFDYTVDGYWSNTGWAGSLADVPTRAVITLVDSFGATYVVENSDLTGDPTLLLPDSEISQNPTIVMASQQNTDKTISLDFTGSGSAATEYVIYLNGIPQPLATKNILGDDSAFVYHSVMNVPAYGNYEITVEALYYGVTVGVASRTISLVAPTPPVVATVPVTSIVTTAQAQESELAETSNPTVAAPSSTNTTVAPSDANGQIKGDEDSSSTNDDNNDTVNWTPWIILFILIILAGAATGGYFYWFAGDEENIAKEEPKKVAPAKPEVKKAVAPKTPAKSTAKKSKRW